MEVFLDMPQVYQLLVARAAILARLVRSAWGMVGMYLLLVRETTAMTTITAREFNRDVSAAKREANRGPVVITDRGEPAYVLLSIDEYRRIGATGTPLVDRLSMDDDIDIEFEPTGIELRVPEL